MAETARGSAPARDHLRADRRPAAARVARLREPLPERLLGRCRAWTSASSPTGRTKRGDGHDSLEPSDRVGVAGGLASAASCRRGGCAGAATARRAPDPVPVHRRQRLAPALNAVLRLAGRGRDARARVHRHRPAPPGAGGADPREVRAGHAAARDDRAAGGSAGVPVDSRIRAGPHARHALQRLLDAEEFDRLVVPATALTRAGFSGEDLVWLLEQAPAEVVILRARRRTTPASCRRHARTDSRPAWPAPVPAPPRSAGNRARAVCEHRGVSTTRDGGDTARAALIVGALGVVFGDIGTSPLYTVQTVFNPSDPHPVPANADSVFGIISLIFWSVTIIVTVTYVLARDARRQRRRGRDHGADHPDPPARRSRAARGRSWRWPRSASSAPRCSSATA